MSKQGRITVPGRRVKRGCARAEHMLSYGGNKTQTFSIILKCGSMYKRPARDHAVGARTASHRSLTVKLNPTLIGLVVLVCAGLPSTADEVTINPTKDNTIFSENGDRSNGQGNSIFTGKTGGQLGTYLRRALIAFDVLAAVPEGSTIDSVSLSLRLQQQAGNANDRTVSLHRMIADWGEAGSAGSGTGAAAQTDDATWTHRFFGSTQWASPGGEFISGASASSSVHGVGQFTQWTSATMVSDVQGWLDDPTSNFGWIVIGDESTSTTAMRFASRETTEGTQRPVLSISFTPGGGQQFSLDVSVAPVSGGTVTGAGAFDEGTNAPITATADEGFRFINWTGEGVADPMASSTTVAVTQARNLTANFSRIWNLTLVAEPEAGGMVTGAEPFVHGSAAVIVATANEGYRFTGWTGDGVADPSEAVTTVSMTQARTISANFVKVWELALIAYPETGGTVTGAGTFDAGATVAITAAPTDGFRFIKWIGEGVEDSLALTTTVVMVAERQISAHFEPLVQDLDSDLVDDRWENQNGLDPTDPTDALIDQDGDGASNIFEFLSGTDPNDRTSVLRIVDFVIESSESFMVRWQSVPGATYAIDSAPELQKWSERGTLIATETQSQFSAQLPNPLAAYVRIRVVSSE